MSDSDNMIVDMTTRIFEDLCDPQTINNARDISWKEPLWTSLQDAGLTAAFVPEELGGAGIDLTDGFEILRVAGRFAVPSPLAETMLAGWLLAKGGIGFPGGRMTVAPVRDRDRLTLGEDGKLSGTARGVPFARESDALAVLAWRGDHATIALVDRTACGIAEGRSLADDAKDDVVLDGVAPTEVGDAAEGIDEHALQMMGALARSCEITGALERMLEISVQYSQDRVAFERPISRFQAVQHNLARLAGEVAASVCASGSAADALQRSGGAFDEGVFLEIAAAKIRTGEAAGEGAAIAHQVHGAIGFTMEHVLHRFSRRVWAWRDEFGSESVWAVRLGNAVAARGGDDLWSMLAAR